MINDSKMLEEKGASFASIIVKVKLYLTELGHSANGNGQGRKNTFEQSSC